MSTLVLTDLPRRLPGPLTCEEAGLMQHGAALKLMQTWTLLVQE
eukprot:SAG31_NODE_18309_length_641_cov_0.485240_1_plen_43_part_10